MKLIRTLCKTTVFVTLTIALLIACSEFDRDAPTITSAQLTVPGQYPVGRLTNVPIADLERQRFFTANVSYPATEAGFDTDLASGQFALLVHSHGFGGNADSATGLQTHMASHGYIVVAPNFPATSSGTGDFSQLDSNDIVNQPGDVSLMIDAALGLNDNFEGKFSSAVDTNKIVLSGLSFGGLTTQLTAFDRQLRDTRVKAAAIFAPGSGDAFLPAFYNNADIPLLFMHGKQDAFIAHDTVANAIVNNARSPLHFISLPNGSHTAFSDVLSGVELGVSNVDAFACDFFPNFEGLENVEPPYVATLRARGPEFGVGTSNIPLPCTFGVENNPAISVELQAEITRIALLAFMNAYLNDDRATTQGYLNFLRSGFAIEQPEVVITTK